MLSPGGINHNIEELIDMSLLLSILGEEEKNSSLNKMISHFIEDCVEWFC